MARLSGAKLLLLLLGWRLLLLGVMLTQRATAVQMAVTMLHQVLCQGPFMLAC